jgi:sigma-B regulation protein RsbU (phosphoserine phosphatase)
MSAARARKQQALFLPSHEAICYTLFRAGPSPAAEFPFTQSMVSIANASLLNELELQREQELAEARAIQRGMLPQASLRTADVTVCYQFHPFQEVGGDFLDFFTLTDGVIGIYLGDVTGKGLPAALYAALAVGTLRGVHKTGTPPASVLNVLNRRVMLRGVSSPRYAAVQYACFDPRTGILRIASAGMEGPLILSETGSRELELRGIPPGMFPETTYESETVQLERGDSVIFLSDGFSESQNSSGDFFDMEQVLETCKPFRENTPEEILDRLTEAVTSYSCGRPQQDDRTAAILRYLPK